MLHETQLIIPRKPLFLIEHERMYIHERKSI
jgi:hypothetical protein